MTALAAKRRTERFRISKETEIETGLARFSITSRIRASGPDTGGARLSKRTHGTATP
jgi:hypothetical protein